MAIVFASVSNQASAQRTISLGTLGGSLEFGYEREHQETQVEGSPSSTFERRRSDRRIEIRDQGLFIFDPRLVTANLGLTFDLFQEQDRFGNTTGSQRGILKGYAFDSAILAEKPYSATLFANRNQSVVSRDFGGQSEITYENRGTTFRLREDSFLKDWGIPYFSSTLGVRQERTREGTTALGQTFQRDEHRNVLNLEANKGFETADLGFRYEFTDLTDTMRPQGGFQTHAADFTYSLDFGPTLNRRWNSRLHYLARTGESPSTYFAADEELRIDHYPNLYTDYRYLLTRQEVEAGTTTTQVGTFLLQHRLYRNLVTRITASGTLQQIVGGRRTSYYGQLDSNYQRSVPPWRGRVFAGIGGRYQIDNNMLASSQIAVVDEPHTAPSPLGAGAGFLLNNPFVIPSTIAVVDTRGGSRLTTTQGVDYQVIQEGDFTRIVPLPTSLVILASDPLAVSYVYEVAPSLKFSTASWWLNGGLDLQWIAFSFSHEQTNQNPLSGRDSQFLQNRRSDSARVEFHKDWERARARAGAGYEILDSTRLAYTRRQFNQLFSFRIRSSLMLTLNADQSFTNFTLPPRQSDTYNWRIMLDGYVLGGWYLTAFAGVRTLKDSTLPSETIREAGLKGRKIWGKLEASPALTWSEYERGLVRTNDLRLTFRAIRRF